MPRARPVVVSTRAAERDAALVRALAEAEGVSVCEVVHRVLIPAVRERLMEIARDPELPEATHG